MSPGLGIDPDDLAGRLHPGVRAVIAVHVQGRLADLGPVRELLACGDIALIEDACQAFGATTGRGPAGSVGDLGVFSFQQAKQLAAGEGGAIVSKDPDLVAACALQVDMGAVRDDAGLPNWDDERAVLGEGCRMTELQAAVLCAQLDELPAVLERQRAVRSRLRTLLEERGVRTVRSADPAGDSASHLILLADGPDHAGAIVARARAGGVLVRLVWNRPYYRHRVFERAGLTPENLGVARAARADDARRTIDLGLASPRAQVRKVALPVFAERVDRAEEVRRARDDPDRSIHRWAAELESRTAGPAPTTLP